MKMKWGHFLFLCICTACLFSLDCDVPTGLIPEIGDWMRLTNDPRPNYDPFLYKGVDDKNFSYGIIGFHDNESIYLFDLEKSSTTVKYTPPDGWLITSLAQVKTTFGNFSFSISDGVSNRIIAYIDDEYIDIYEYDGAPIDDIDGYSSGSYIYVVFEIEKEIYLIIYDSDEDNIFVNKHLTSGFDIWIEFTGLLIFYFVDTYEDFDQIFIMIVDPDGSFPRYDPLFEGDEIWNSNKRYPVISYEFICFTSDFGGSVDVWKGYFDQLTNSSFVENDLYLYGHLLFFNQDVDGQNDIFVIRCAENPPLCTGCFVL